MIKYLSNEYYKTVKLYEQYRRNKQWNKADKLRDCLCEQGYIVRNDNNGVYIRPWHYEDMDNFIVYQAIYFGTNLTFKKPKLKEFIDNKTYDGPPCIIRKIGDDYIPFMLMNKYDWILAVFSDRAQAEASNSESFEKYKYLDERLKDQHYKDIYNIRLNAFKKKIEKYTNGLKFEKDINKY